MDGVGVRSRIARTVAWLQPGGRSGSAFEGSVVLVAAIAYVLTAARTVQGGDSGELAAVGAHGGVAHPPGYPLYTLALRATSWLPAASPAQRAGLTTAAIGALSVFALQRACRAWGVRTGATVLVTAAYAVSPLAWRLSTEPEVFTLNVLVAMLIAIAASPRAAASQSALRRATTLGLLAGLGIANHHTIVLLAPLGLLALGRALVASTRRIRDSGITLAAFAIGLCPYGYLVWVTRTAPLTAGCIWGDARSFEGLARHFLRADYGTTRLAVSNQEPDVPGQLVHLGRTLFVSGIGPLLLVALLGWLVLRPRLRWSWDVGALAASFLIAGPVFVARFNLPPRGLAGIVVDRFHLLPLALGALLAAIGLERMMHAVGPRISRRTAPPAIGILLVALVLQGVSTARTVHAHHRTTIEHYLRNVLALLPARAVLLAQGDDQVGGFAYMQCALGARPDVDVVSPHLLLTDWYAERTSARLGFEVERGRVPPGMAEPVLESSRLLEQVLETGRPIFVTGWFANNLESAFASYPFGPVIHVVRGREQLPPPAVLYDWNLALFASMTLDDAAPPRATWAGARYVDYARPWLVLATAFEREGDAVRARECRERAARLTPR